MRWSRITAARGWSRDGRGMVAGGRGARRPPPLAVCAHGSGAFRTPLGRFGAACGPFAAVSDRFVRHSFARTVAPGALRVAVTSIDPCQVGGAVATTNEAIVQAARESTGLATVYRALDDLVDLYGLEDAAVV